MSLLAMLLPSGEKEAESTEPVLPRKVRRVPPSFTSQSSTLLRPPTATLLLSSVKATEGPSRCCPRIVVPGLFARTSHRRTTSSNPPDASHRPSWENFTDHTQLSC